AVIAHISPAAPAPTTTTSNASAIASVRPGGGRHAHAGLDRQRPAVAIQLELAVLHHGLQPHRAVGERDQRAHRGIVDVEHGEVVDARQRGAMLVPPDVGAAPAVVDHDYLARAAGGLADARFVGLAEVDPQ